MAFTKQMGERLPHSPSPAGCPTKASPTLTHCKFLQYPPTHTTQLLGLHCLPGRAWGLPDAPWGGITHPRPCFNHTNRQGPISEGRCISTTTKYINISLWKKVYEDASVQINIVFYYNFLELLPAPFLPWAQNDFKIIDMWLQYFINYPEIFVLFNLRLWFWVFLIFFVLFLLGIFCFVLFFTTSAIIWTLRRPFTWCYWNLGEVTES